MLIESIIRRQGGSTVDLGSAKYHFRPDLEGRHVAEVDDPAHIATLLAIKEGFRPADGSVLSTAGELPVIEGAYFIFRGPQDAEAFADWLRAIPDMLTEPAEFVLLIDKIAAGEANLDGFPLPEPRKEPISPASLLAGVRVATELSSPPPPANSIVPNQADSPGSDAGGLQDTGDGGAGAAGGAGSDTDEEEDGDEEEEDAPPPPPPPSGDLDREALAKEYDELIGHRPNGRWSAEKIAAAIAEHKAG
ncbi:hypothetical protein [Sphingobium yanoikuyae]|uniref:hypothetical protein n=1 Tax=Sphingobium yanoikuyae TaxID=13690 RepID=UPI0004E299FB|nr:hypothetical protein [Sphingobium yanoikuyae]KFD27077.1 hypothetical protein IH86_16945 [Sphingobium yanoikuyae]MDV3479876.1 hypothetical protein [Sphingobium yanoikuyae]